MLASHAKDLQLREQQRRDHLKSGVLEQSSDEIDTALGTRPQEVEKAQV